MYGQIIEEIYHNWNEITTTNIERPCSINVLTNLAYNMLQNNIQEFLKIIIANNIPPEIFKNILLYLRFNGKEFMKNILITQIKIELQKISQIIYCNQQQWTKNRLQYERLYDSILIQVKPIGDFVLPINICGSSNIEGVTNIDTRSFENIIDVHRFVLNKQVEIIHSDINLKIIYPPILEKKKRDLCAIIPYILNYKDNKEFVENMYKTIYQKTN